MQYGTEPSVQARQTGALSSNRPAAVMRCNKRENLFDRWQHRHGPRFLPETLETEYIEHIMAQARHSHMLAAGDIAKRLLIGDVIIGVIIGDDHFHKAEFLPLLRDFNKASCLSQADHREWPHD